MSSSHPVARFAETVRKLMEPEVGLSCELYAKYLGRLEALEKFARNLRTTPRQDVGQALHSLCKSFGAMEVLVDTWAEKGFRDASLWSLLLEKDAEIGFLEGMAAAKRWIYGRGIDDEHYVKRDVEDLGLDCGVEWSQVQEALPSKDPDRPDLSGPPATLQYCRVLEFLRALKKCDVEAARELMEKGGGDFITAWHKSVSKPLWDLHSQMPPDAS